MGSRPGRCPALEYGVSSIYVARQQYSQPLPNVVYAFTSTRSSWQEVSVGPALLVLDLAREGREPEVNSRTLLIQ